MAAAGSKWSFNSSGGSATSSFGQDSGYTSYQSVTPNNTFNASSRHGASGTLATIDEANETDCSMNDSSSGLPIAAQVLTPNTVASIDRISNFHLTTPKTRRLPFDSLAEPSVGPVDAHEGSFTLPTTPERSGSRGGSFGSFLRSQSFETYETPLRSVNRSIHQHSQQTPHKVKSGQSLKRKLPSFRDKLRSEGDTELLLLADLENRENDPNDSLDADCQRLPEDISPIPNTKRRKRHDGIADLMRSSTPKTACFKTDENQDANVLAGKRTLRKFVSFSPGKLQTVRHGKVALRQQQLAPGKGGLVRQNAFTCGPLTPEKKEKQPLRVREPKTIQEEGDEEAVGGETVALQSINLGALLSGPILEGQGSKDESGQLEDTIARVPSFDDCSLTPSKAFATEDGCVTRHAPNFSYSAALTSIVEESPLKWHLLASPKQAKIKPCQGGSVAKSVRKLKRLGTNGSNSSSSLSSPGPRFESRSATKCRSPKLCPFPLSKQRRTCYYDGKEYVDILHRLNRDDKDALEIVLGHLTSSDLVQVVRVSRTWRAIVKNHTKSKLRLHKQLKSDAKEKENNYDAPGGAAFAKQLTKDNSPNILFAASGDGTLPDPNPQPPDLEGESLPADLCGTFSSIAQRRPFKPCNSLDRNCSSSTSLLGTSFASAYLGNVSIPEVRRRSSVSGGIAMAKSHSPPISPSKRKFYNNQKVASHLKESEQLRPCPRCERPSRIIFSRSTKGGNRSTRANVVAARLDKSYTMPDPDTNGNTAIADGSGYIGEDQRRNASTENDHCKSTNSPDRIRRNLFNTSSDSNGLITTPSAGKQKHHVASGRQNSSEPVVDRMKLRSMTSNGTKSVESSLAVADDTGNESKCDYAICSGQNCGFTFCIQCLCEHHPDHVCIGLAPNSPSREERGRPNVACTRQSRRSLQRLCK
ncbi:uncharacterized protein LOC131215091 [Anopheles bellator]|uniref:uncharacterized protein LOC131215091 n=1 Tax=Anopheles bellator TaxID=139047 RepID=UPI002649635B|nr:uncharacterized protein LOC131215091 [Anopheles bellator]